MNAATDSAALASAVLDDAQLVYLYDGTLEGLLSAVYVAFARRENPLNISQAAGLQESLLTSPVPLTTNLEQSERVQLGILEKLGQISYNDIKLAFLSDSPEKGGVILRFLQYAMKRGCYAGLDFAHPAVSALQQLTRQVSNEAHYFKQFIRFAELEGGLYYARITPKANVLPLIMDHFAERFNIQPFVIVDSCHRLAGVFDRERWWLAEIGESQPETSATQAAALGFSLPKESPEQDEYQALWQIFYDTIAIEERRNPSCQRNFMPKRFWGNMCEHIPPQLRKTEAQAETSTPSQIAKRLSAARSAPIPHQMIQRTGARP